MSHAEKRHQAVERAIIDDPSILGLQTYEYLENTLLAEQDAFIQCEPVQLEHPHLNLDTLQEKEARTRELLLTLNPSESLESEALYEALSWRQTELCMLGWMSVLLTQRGDTETSAWQRRADIAIHGEPEIKEFSGMVAHEISPLLQIPVHKDHANATAIQNELSTLITVPEGTPPKPFLPNAESVERVGKIIKSTFDTFIDPIDPSKTYTMPETAEALSEVLRVTGLEQAGWKAELTDGSNSLAVSAAERKIKVGRDRKDIQGKILQSRSLHELAVHGLRAQNGLESGWLSAGLGQDKYLEFEEGLATAFEDAFNNTAKPHGWQYYIALGLAAGLDNDQPRNMRQVYDIVWRYKAMQKYDNGTDLSPETVYKAQKVALRQCKRIFRGTSGEVPGLVYSKDLSYFNGQAKAWSILNAARNADDLHDTLVGKLDLNDPFHQRIAERIRAIK